MSITLYTHTHTTTYTHNRHHTISWLIYKHLTSTQRNTSEGTPHTQTLTILGDTDHTFGDRTTSERDSIGACFPATGVHFGILGESFFTLLGVRDSKPFLVRVSLPFLPALLPACCLACSFVGCCPDLLYSPSHTRSIQPSLSTWLPHMNPSGCLVGRRTAPQ